MAKIIFDPFYFIENRHMKMKGGKGGSSKAPDANKVAAAQTQVNKDTAWYNAMLENMNQITPYGNLTYTNNGDKENPQWTSTISLSPEQQKLYDLGVQGDTALSQLGNEQIGRIRDSVSTPYSYDNIGYKLPTEGDINAQYQNAYKAYTDRLNPQFDRDEEALRTRLINQGIGQGSEAYNREMQTFNQSKNDALSQAILASQAYGSNAANQQLNLRNQAINEYNAQRNAPLNEYNAFTGGSQVTNPTFSSGGNSGTQPVDIAGLIQSQYNANQAAANNRSQATSSLFGLGGKAAGLYLTGGNPVGGAAGSFLGSGIGSLFGK